MRLKTESNAYDVTFNHGILPRGRRFTLAGVYQFEGPHGMSATAYCNPSDNFNKARGRKVALKRAIADLPREERRQIWAAYFAAIDGVK